MTQPSSTALQRRRVDIIPPVGAGQRIGLLGGSFNPPHEGHRHVAETAIRRLDLHQVWCLVTPGNPLKDTSGLASLENRVAATRQVMRHPRIRVSAFEADAGLRYSIDTIRHLTSRRPAARFVWVMGADSFVDFDRWRKWQAIFEMLPVAIVDRPNSRHEPLRARAARRFERFRLPEADCARLPDLMPPAWVFLHGPLHWQSSTILRKSRQK